MRSVVGKGLELTRNRLVGHGLGSAKQLSSGAPLSTHADVMAWRTSASRQSGRSSGKLQLFTFDAAGAPECSCSRRSPGDAAALAARISSTGNDEGLILAARPFTKRFVNVPASSATCSGNVEAMTIEFPSSPIGASPCEYSLKRRS